MTRISSRIVGGLVAAAVLVLGAPAAATAATTADDGATLADTGSQLPLGWLIVGAIALLAGIAAVVISKLRNRQ